MEELKRCVEVVDNIVIIIKYKKESIRVLFKIMPKFYGKLKELSISSICIHYNINGDLKILRDSPAEFQFQIKFSQIFQRFELFTHPSTQ